MECADEHRGCRWPVTCGERGECLASRPRPLIPDHVWVDGMFDALKAQLPDEDEAKLREFAVELVTIAKNRGAQMKRERESRE